MIPVPTLKPSYSAAPPSAAHTSTAVGNPRFPAFFCIAFLLATFILAAIIPAFQAPDEFQHVERQYMLSKGQILLHSKGHAPSGGRVDNGLLEFMSYYTPMKGVSTRKVSQDEAVRASQVRWSGEWTYESPVGTASYFPALYAPQASGLLVGKMLGLSVSQSYRLARYACLFSCALLIWLAARIWEPPTIVFALIAMPMNLFLVASSVLDGTSLAMFTLAMSLFFRMVHERESTHVSMVLAFSVAIASVAACRANMLPMLLLPFVVARYTRSRRDLIIAAATAVLVLGWTIYTITHAVYPEGARHGDNAGRLGHFVTHPWVFVTMLYDTVTDPAILSFYGYSFIGILGWFDAALPLWSYGIIAGLLLAVAAVTVRWRGAYDTPLARNAVILAALGAVGMTFLALLVQWTPSGATKIDGVQGRYFMLPAVALCFAVLPTVTSRARATGRIAKVLAFVVLCFSFMLTVQTVVTRYHTQLEQPAADSQGMAASAPLSASHPLDIHFPAAQMLDPAPLERIAVRIGTYAMSHAGDAELQAWTRDGETFSTRFPLSALVDNGYKDFQLDGKPYVGARIVSIDGGGVSLYDYRMGTDATISCAALFTATDRMLLPLACPREGLNMDVKGRRSSTPAR